jgi:porin
MSQRSGQNLSDEAVGSVFNVATVCCGAVVKLVSLALEQSLFDERLDIAIGRLAAGDDFLTSPLDWNFVSNAFDGNPVGVFFDIPYSAYPNTVWGARVRGKPTPELQLQVGVYNGDPDVVDDHNHGVDFSWRSGKGVVTVAEIAWLRNQRDASTGLAGNYKIGGFFHSGPFAVLEDPPAPSNTATVGSTSTPTRCCGAKAKPAACKA